MSKSGSEGLIISNHQVDPHGFINRNTAPIVCWPPSSYNLLPRLGLLVNHSQRHLDVIILVGREPPCGTPSRVRPAEFPSNQRIPMTLRSYCTGGTTGTNVRFVWNSAVAAQLNRPVGNLANSRADYDQGAVPQLLISSPTRSRTVELLILDFLSIR